MVNKGEKKAKQADSTHARAERVEVVSRVLSKGEPEAAILERKRESGVPLFCVPRQRRSSQPENVSTFVVSPPLRPFFLLYFLSSRQTTTVPRILCGAVEHYRG